MTIICRAICWCYIKRTSVGRSLSWCLWDTAMIMHSNAIQFWELCTTRGCECFANMAPPPIHNRPPTSLHFWTPLKSGSSRFSWILPLKILGKHSWPRLALRSSRSVVPTTDRMPKNRQTPLKYSENRLNENFQLKNKMAVRAG